MKAYLIAPHDGQRLTDLIESMLCGMDEFIIDGIQRSPECECCATIRVRGGEDLEGWIAKIHAPGRQPSEFLAPPCGGL